MCYRRLEIGSKVWRWEESMASAKKGKGRAIVVEAAMPDEGAESMLRAFRRFSIGKGKARREFHLAMRIPVDRRRLNVIQLEEVTRAEQQKSRRFRGIISPAEFVLTSQASEASGHQIGPPVVVEFAMGRVADAYRGDFFVQLNEKVLGVGEDYSEAMLNFDFLSIRFQSYRYVDGRPTFVKIRDTELDWVRIRDEAIKLAGVEIEERTVERDDRMEQVATIVRYEALRLEELKSRGIGSDATLRERILEMYAELGGWEAAGQYGEIGPIKEQIVEALSTSVKTIEKYVKEAERPNAKKQATKKGKKK